VKVFRLRRSVERRLSYIYIYNTTPSSLQPQRSVLSIVIYILTSLKGYLTWSSFRTTIFFFFFVLTCSTHTSLVSFPVNSRINRGSQSSLAMPKSLQHRMSALDLHPSVAVGMPSGSK
jgi:hypothetical protein